MMNYFNSEKVGVKPDNLRVKGINELAKDWAEFVGGYKQARKIVNEAWANGWNACLGEVLHELRDIDESDLTVAEKNILRRIQIVREETIPDSVKRKSSWYIAASAKTKPEKRFSTPPHKPNERKKNMKNYLTNVNNAPASDANRGK